MTNSKRSVLHSAHLFKHFCRFQIDKNHLLLPPSILSISNRQKFRYYCHSLFCRFEIDKNSGIIATVYFVDLKSTKIRYYCRRLFCRFQIDKSWILGRGVHPIRPSNPSIQNVTLIIIMREHHG